MISEQGYETFTSFECLNASLANYMRFYNLGITPSEIFFLGDGFNIAAINNPHFHITSNMYISSFNFLDSLKFDYIHDTCITDPMIFLRESILGNKAIVIKVASKYLNYNRVFRQAENASHYINAIGLCENKICISDGFVPTREPSSYQGWVSLNDILEGWGEKEYEYLCIQNFHVQMEPEPKKI